MIKNKLWWVVFPVLFMVCSCNISKIPAPSHIKIGEPVTFIGADPNTSYITVGYKDKWNGKVEKQWDQQDYVVFTYLSANKVMKQGTIPTEAVIKQKDMD